MDYMCESVRGLSSRRLRLKIALGRSHLAVIRDDAHSEIESHVYQEEGVWEDVEALPRQPTVAVQEGNLHGDPNQVQECDGHHAHDVVTPAGRHTTGVLTGRQFVLGHCAERLTAWSLRSLLSQADLWALHGRWNRNCTSASWGAQFLSSYNSDPNWYTVSLFWHHMLDLHANGSEAAWIVHAMWSAEHIPQTGHVILCLWHFKHGININIYIHMHSCMYLHTFFFNYMYFLAICLKDFNT